MPLLPNRLRAPCIRCYKCEEHRGIEKKKKEPANHKQTLTQRFSAFGCNELQLMKTRSHYFCSVVRGGWRVKSLSSNALFVVIVGGKNAQFGGWMTSLLPYIYFFNFSFGNDECKSETTKKIMFMHSCNAHNNNHTMQGSDFSSTAKSISSNAAFIWFYTCWADNPANVCNKTELKRRERKKIIILDFYDYIFFAHCTSAEPRAQAKKR
jgi:hypothetical protein